MSEDLKTLLAGMRSCSLCDGLELGAKPIFKLSQNAKILVVGQAPGRIAHEKGRPFDDPSGERLRSWLAVDKAAFYEDDRIGIFPMGLCFPGKGRSGDNPPRSECADTWRSRVMAALKNVELTLVLGRYAIAWHLPQLKNTPVTEAVKHCAEGKNGIFVLPHPSPRNNRWLLQNDWFEQRVIPRIQDRVARLLG
ncbi:Uracil DNA glycosylase superfamily protein [Roseovarius litorisediminis]|uniref:Uracil DNA glycosylase superfamily protein n=1 Tax=Roseovarius litorisediminis TaxID=1312363 RepID=A0A1Y5RWP2_9RHOB|nr:uracil-DNA glycosylase family protein [Roseovarius litorisediminis]SLN24332.1 Uracil DNA glycosylase superfamily protein [Roseovarius litorisediminis]